MPNLTNLRELLKERGRAEELSRNTGISSGNISDWKSGRSKPGLESLLKIADYFNCSIDYLLGRTSIKEVNKPTNDVVCIHVCKQKASAGIGNILYEYNQDLYAVYFESSKIPKGTTHGIIIDGHSMEPKFFDNQIVFIQFGLECEPSDYGIFSVTDDDLQTRIYCKQLMQSADGSKYLHSVNKEIGDPDINYENAIDIHCIGRVLM